jgi:hypothetical protein
MPLKEKRLIRQRIVDATLGDCMTACIATILEIPYSEAWYGPRDIKKGEGWTASIQRWANKRGLEYVYCHAWSGFVPSGFHVIDGKSPRFDVSHAVVGLDGSIFFDPSPSQTGLSSVSGYGVFIPRMMFPVGMSSLFHPAGFVPDMFKPTHQHPDLCPSSK